MAKPAYIVLNASGTVVRTHSTDLGTQAGGTTSGANDVESLISNGYQAKRELALDGGSILIVMEKP